MTRYQDGHNVHTGDIGDPHVQRFIEALAQADEDKGLRLAEEYGEPLVHPLIAKGNHTPTMPSSEGEFFGTTFSGERIGPFDTERDRNRAVDEVNKMLEITEFKQ